MIWTTPVSINDNPNPIDYHSKVFSIGSCFAVNIAEKLSHYKFNSVVNPFGILFHPLAIDDLLSRAIDTLNFEEYDTFRHNDVYQSYSVHSALSKSDRNVFLSDLNRKLGQTQTDLREASHVIITYGTAWVYKHIDSDKVVANCHKVSSAEFQKGLLSVSEIEVVIRNTIQSLLKINSTIKIIFTISPVRHVKEGLIENHRSKSNLFSALHNVISECETETISYFPSYEIVMDELRDYRFYASDLLHPNEIAINYIWNRFVYTSISATSQGILNQIAALIKSQAHRPIGEITPAYQAHVSATQSKIQDFCRSYPHIKFDI